jgi:hypothetical protein
VLKEGLLLDMRPTLSTDRRHVRLELSGTWSHVVRPIPDFHTMLGGRRVTVQLPELVVRRSNTNVRLPDGGSVLIRPQRDEEAEVETVLLVRVQVIDLEAEERKMRGR